MTTPEQLVYEVGELVSLPRAYQRINEMLEDPRYGPTDIGRVIAHDPALTARVLRIVNSAYYRFPTKIDNIPLAITVLGTRALRELVLATSVASAFDKINTRLVDVADFWHHSIYCGILARLLSRRLKRGQSEQLFVAGLLHDLGKLVIYHRLPAEASTILSRFAEADMPLYMIEREVLGFDHAAVGAALLEHWELPEVFRQTTAFHHAPEQASFADETALIHVANALTKKVEPGHKLKHDYTTLPELHPSAAARVPLTEALVEELRLEADVQSIEVFSTLFSAAPAPA
jgi:putative nucleotidyltransferase with HDIG domain